MRISTSQMFGTPTRQMATLTSEADKLQTQISTGKRITGAADDPVAFQRLDSIRRASADDDAYSANVKLAQGLLAETDDTLGTIENRLQRARELTLQAGNGTLSQAERTVIAAELDSLVADLVKLANTRDSRGQPMFGGADGALPYAVQPDQSIAYVGTGQPSAIPVGEGASIAVAATGDRVFGGIDDGNGGTTDMFAILAGLAAALQPGATDPDGAIEDALSGLDKAMEQVATTRTSVGARAIRMDFEAERLTEASISRESRRSELEDADLSTSIADLQRTLTVLQATQASFTRLTSLSLFDQLR